MSTNKTVKVLLVPDVIWGEDSGAVSARVTARALGDAGYEVGVYAYPGDPVAAVDKNAQKFAFFPRRKSSTINHFYGGKVLGEFSRTLAEYRPDYVLFVGAAISKPVCFFKACLERRIPYLLLFYINDYYCMRIYAGLKDGPCFKCINGNYTHALINNCQKGVLQFIKGALVIRKLKGLFHKCHKAFGYSKDQLALYIRHGFSPEQCVKSPVHFESKCVLGVDSIRGNYFVLCGQTTIEKGWHLMAEIVRQCPTVHFKFVFPVKSAVEEKITTFGLRNYVERGQIEVLSVIKDHDEFMNLLAGARGVLVPSYYPTTGEFVLLEALGLGKPVIVFNAGVHKEIINSGRNGLMAEIGDLRGYADHINRLNSDDALYYQISAGAKVLFEELTSSGKVAAALRNALMPPSASRI